MKIRNTYEVWANKFGSTLVRRSEFENGTWRAYWQDEDGGCVGSCHRGPFPTLDALEAEIRASFPNCRRVRVPKVVEELEYVNGKVVSEKDVPLTEAQQNAYRMNPNAILDATSFPKPETARRKAHD